MAREVTDKPRPTFLLSSERSGSNLLRSILNTHSTVSAPHPIETAYPWQNLAPPRTLSDGKVRKLIRDILINKRYSFHPLTVPLDPDRVFDRLDNDCEHPLLAIQSALYEEVCEVEESSVWSSKYPGLWDCLEEGFDWYDGLRIVYLVRDPRDVVLSFKRSNIDLYHPFLSAKRWQKEQALGLGLLASDGDAVHLIHYEDLLRNPEAEVRDLCEFIDVPFQESMLYYYETEDAQAASGSSELLENVGVPIQSDNYGKFRTQLPDEEVKLTERLTLDEMGEFGYDRVYSRSELENFEPLEESAYEDLDRELQRSARFRHWRNAPLEQVKRSLTKSYTAYMYLRYGVLT